MSDRADDASEVDGDRERNGATTPAEKVATLRGDPILASVIDEQGVLQLEPAPDPFARLVTSILNQQLSVASAAAIRERLFESVEVTPEGILDTDEATLRECGLSTQKIGYTRNVARAFTEGDIRITELEAHSDEEVIEALTEISGIGVWTAKMALMFVFAREDVFPVEDLGIRKGVEKLYGEHTRAEMEALSARWQPYRSLASLYLWRAVE